MADDYRFELLTHERREIEAMSALLRAVFPHAPHLTADYLQWKYSENPDGRAVGCNAWIGDELVGHMAAVPLRASLDGQERRGLFLQNGAVRADHRGRKLQSRISAAIFDDAVRQGYAFCVGAGNKYSTKPLLTRFRMLCPMDARIGLGAPLRSERAFEASFERIWSEQALRWRLSNPQRRYFVKDGQVLAETAWPGIAAILHDATSLPDTPRRAPGPLRVWLGLDPRADWRRSRFLPIPVWLRPSPLNLVFKDLSADDLMPDPARIVFRAFDFDPW